MFCEKCGTQVEDNQPFCPTCGNKLAAEPVQQPAAAPAAAPASALKNVLGGMSKNDQMFLFGALGALFLGLIFSLLPTIKVSVSFMGYSTSASASFGQADAAYVTILIILGNLAAMALLLLPLFGILKKNSLFKLIAGCCAGLGALLTIIAWIVAAGQTKGLGSAGLSFVGWLLLIFQLGAAGLCIYMYLNEKKQA